ncbi:ATP-binding cassette domain-containing protein [Alteromonadaceae bacterium M269]|nr:ATP-binding cassette domain-containing protein [Alteromonadaceae bacterium M269]
MYQLENVTLTRQKKRLLSGVSLSLATHRITALIGANGAGKSTLMKVLLGEYKVDCGEVMFKGKSLHQWKLKQLSFQRAYVAQSERPVFDAKVYDYLLLAREHHQESLTQACRWGEEVADIVGIAHLLDSSITRLSGGEFQLLAFARAWLQLAKYEGLDGTVMLLDEPTSALDIKQSQKLYRLLHQYKEKGGTVLIIEHDINQANQYCDHIAILKQGELLVEGTSQACFSENYLNQCFETEGYLQHNEHTNKPTYILNHEWENNV